MTFRELGSVQGRLLVSPNGELQCFPGEAWEEEFGVLGEIGFQLLEWLTERTFNENNPFWSDTGRKKISEASKNSGIEVRTACADYIIDNSFFENDFLSVRSHVTKFLGCAAELGCKGVVLPFLEQSCLTKLNIEDCVGPLKELALVASELNLVINLETLLEGSELVSLLDQVNSDHLKVVFDTGNRVQLTARPEEEIVLLGERINHVHVKDKNENGQNVLLGTGLVNFERVFNSLHNINYKGPLIFETTRGNCPYLTGKYNKSFVEFFSKNAEKC